MTAPARKILGVLGAMLFAFPAIGVHAAPAATPAKTMPAADLAATQVATPAFATINGEAISAAQFETALKEAAREKFYHGTPPEQEVERLMREVAYNLVDRMLLPAEAQRRGLKADGKAVQEGIARYEKRHATRPGWQQERETILVAVRERFETDNLIAQLEAQTRNVAEPSPEKVREYFRKHPDKFTEPEKMRVSIILLSVDPSSPIESWKAAETRAGVLRLQLTEGGADFAALARQHSQHESAAAGGDLGYLHRGMLPDGIQQSIDAMKPGDLSPPTRVLEGFTLFRYESYQAPKKHDFDTVKGRARDLLVRDLQNAAWDGLRKKLRGQAKLEFNTQLYPALDQKAGTEQK